MIKHEVKPAAGGGQPEIWKIIEGDDTGVDNACAWLTEQSVTIENTLDSHGLLLIRGLQSLHTAEDFDRAIRSVCSQLRDYVGGTSPRRQVHGQIMTATETPPSWSIPLHQEMAYDKNPPDRLAFFCQEPAAGGNGGLSTFGDMKTVRERIDPSVRDRCERHGLQLRRTLPSPSTADRKPGVRKTWQEVFAVTDRDSVDDIAAARDWRTSWLDEDTLQLWQDLLPATRRHPVSGVEVWFNQAHFFAPAAMIAWAERDGREDDRRQLVDARQRHPEMLDNIFYGNGEPVPDEDALHIVDVLVRAENMVALERHDLVIFDNMLVSHGRTAFTGRRAILVALITVPRFAGTFRD